MSRVTARRYLEYLADAGTVSRAARYGAPGRPENEYRWTRPRPNQRRRAVPVIEDDT